MRAFRSTGSDGGKGTARGSKASFSTKQKRTARKIEMSSDRRGDSSKTAAWRAGATVNEQSGRGRKTAGKRQG